MYKDLSTQVSKLKEAMYYQKINESIVGCCLCPHRCSIKEGHVGLCGVRYAMNGKLYSLNYGLLSGVAIDPIEKKPLHTYYPGTKIMSVGSFGCNLSCKFCQNYELSCSFDLDLIMDRERITTDQIIYKTKEYQLPGIAYTYSEPTVFYEWMLECAKKSSEELLHNVLVSNGYIEKEPLNELLPYMDAMNIDIKSYDKDRLRSICNGSLEPVLNTVSCCLRENKHVELTMLIVPGLNDDIESYKHFFSMLKERFGDVYIHLSRYFPRYKYNEDATDIQLMIRIQEIGLKFFSHVKLGNVR